MMKSIFAVILASMILFFSAGFKIATHYCGDVAMTSALTTDASAEGCGMEQNQIISNCDSETAILSKKNCCKDEIVSLEIQDNYQPTEKVTLDQLCFLSAFIKVFIYNNFEKHELVASKTYSPPLVHQNILVEQQTFLI